MESDYVYTPKRAMAIYAHPDDIEFSCSGTLARWVAAGCVVSYVLVTSGDVGIAREGMTRSEAIEIRESEQKEAAAVIGAEEVIFLREPDGMVQPTLELRKRLVREIRRFKPEALLTTDPTFLFGRETYINHPDHRATGLVALDAVFPAAGQPNLFEELEEEGLTAHKTRKVYVSSWGADDLSYVNISGTIDKKIAALRAHKSQFDGWDPAERVREWASLMAKGKEMEYAEAFRVVTLETDEYWEEQKGRRF
jgi:LmbE family N-acetylglucosaminyl deacetylase